MPAKHVGEISGLFKFPHEAWMGAAGFEILEKLFDAPELRFGLLSELGVIWGFIGSETARFSHFLRGPAAVAAYLGKKNGELRFGHNPIGGWSVLAMLVPPALVTTME